MPIRRSAIGPNLKKRIESCLAVHSSGSVRVYGISKRGLKDMLYKPPRRARQRVLSNLKKRIERLGEYRHSGAVVQLIGISKRGLKDKVFHFVANRFS